MWLELARGDLRFIPQAFRPALQSSRWVIPTNATSIRSRSTVLSGDYPNCRELLVCLSLRQRDLIVDNIGLPARSYNLAFADGSTIGINDGVILVALTCLSISSRLIW
jgi:hypothetical protein